MKVATVSAAAVFAVLDQAWKYLQGGVLGAAAFIGACATLWIWVLRPLLKSSRELVRQARDVHGVILGDVEKGHPSLVDRLERGDGDFERIEAKVDDLRRDVGGPGGVKERLTTVEGVIDVLGATERQEIKTALSAARIHPRRATDPPLPPTPLRREAD